MIDLTQREVLLFKILISLFGKENVIPKMSLKAVCENSVETASLMNLEDAQLQLLFTVVNNDDVPKLVVEFAAETSKYVDLYSLEREKKVRQFLSSHSIRSIHISEGEYDDLIRSASDRDFVVKFFQDKCGLFFSDEGDCDESM